MADLRPEIQALINSIRGIELTPEEADAFRFQVNLSDRGARPKAPRPPVTIGKVQVEVEVEPIPEHMAAHFPVTVEGIKQQKIELELLLAYVEARDQLRGATADIIDGAKDDQAAGA